MNNSGNIINRISGILDRRWECLKWS